MMQTDDELVRLHLQGDAAAFPELVQRYLRMVYNLAYRSTGDVMEAENIVQETFARAFAALPRSREAPSFRPWVLTIAINLCRNRARRAGHEWEARAGSEGEGFLEQVPDPAPDPLERVLAGEASAELERALAELALPYRQALVLRYMEGLSYEELSRVLDLPLNTVRTHLFRAKERLRQALVRLREGKANGLPGRAAAPGGLSRGAPEPRRGGAGGRAPRPLLGLPEESV